MIMYSMKQSTTIAGIFKQSMGARHRVGIGLSYRPAGLHRLADSFVWEVPDPDGMVRTQGIAFPMHSLESIPGLHKRLKIRALVNNRIKTKAT
jgi:hypothetical protein